jgi:hypothetical protein
MLTSSSAAYANIKRNASSVRHLDNSVLPGRPAEHHHHGASLWVMSGKPEYRGMPSSSRSCRRPKSGAMAPGDRIPADPDGA